MVGASVMDRVALDASADVSIEARAPALFAGRVPAGFVVERPVGELSDELEGVRESVRQSTTMIESYIDRRRQAIIEVHAEPRARARAMALDGGHAWARWLFGRWAPGADLSDRSLWNGWRFRASSAPDGARRAEVRLFQVEWDAPFEGSLFDVLVGAVERGDFTYVVYVVLPAGAAHWDGLEEVPDRASIPRRDLRTARALHAELIATLR